VSRVRHAGATGQLTIRADSGFYNHDIVAVCRKMRVRYSITVRQQPSLRNLIAAIPESDWEPISYWMEGGADVAETEYTPFSSAPDAVPVRLIVRRVKPTPGSQLARWTTRIGLSEPVSTTKTLRRRFFSLAGRITLKARRITLYLPQDWPWQNQFTIRPFLFPPVGNTWVRTPSCTFLIAHRWSNQSHSTPSVDSG